MKFSKLLHSKRNMLIVFLILSVVVGAYYLKEGFRRKFGMNMKKIEKRIHRAEQMHHHNKPVIAPKPKPKAPVVDMEIVKREMKKMKVQK